LTDLIVHPASDEERRAAFRNVHEVWGGGRPLDEYVAWREQSIQHRRATWWVGTLGAEVVVSLGVYPLTFSCTGHLVPGFGIGAVHTVPSARRKGYASTLCAHVIAHQASRGDHFGLLFSDIDPGYYARMGFHVVDDAAWSSDAPDAWASSDLALEHIAEPTSIAGELAALHTRTHAGVELTLARDDEYASYLLTRYPDALHFVHRVDGAVAGYCRMWLKGDGPHKRATGMEWFSSVDDAELFAAMLCKARDLGARRFRSWHAPPASHQGAFVRDERDSAITMVSSLREAQAWDAERLQRAVRVWATDHF